MNIAVKAPTSGQFSGALAARAYLHPLKTAKNPIFGSKLAVR